MRVVLSSRRRDGRLVVLSGVDELSSHKTRDLLEKLAGVETRVPAADRSTGEGSLLAEGGRSAPLASVARSALMHEIEEEEQEDEAEAEADETREQEEGSDAAAGGAEFDAAGMVASGQLEEVRSMAVEALPLSEVPAMLVVAPDEMTPYFELASGNLQRLKWCFAEQANPLDILKARVLVVTPKAVGALENRLLSVGVGEGSDPEDDEVADKVRL